MKKITYIFIPLLSIVFCACDKEDETSGVGTLDIAFNNTINDVAIALNTTEYSNDSEESFKISELKYIVSNIVLIKASGEEFVYPVADSYFVVNEDEASSKAVSLKDIAVGEYSQIRFGIGVDQSNYPLNGVNNFIPTAEENGMLWSWSAGYKFLKFEGTYTTGAVENADFLIHVGTHGTTLDNYKEVTLDLPTNLEVSNEASSMVSIDTDVAKIFDSTNTHSLAVKSEIQVDPENAPRIAENVSTMFEVVGVSN